MRAGEGVGVRAVRGRRIVATLVLYVAFILGATTVKGDLPALLVIGLVAAARTRGGRPADDDGDPGPA